MSIKKLIFWILICELVGFIGSFFTYPAIPVWFAGLAKPFFSPPNWLFAPVWTVLFALMGVAIHLVLQAGFKNNKVRKAAEFFGLQMALNLLWSALFFGLRSPQSAFIEITGLWLAIAVTIWSFWRVSKQAALLMLPYIYGSHLPRC
jgi:benzodiazapine receptor